MVSVASVSVGFAVTETKWLFATAVSRMLDAENADATFNADGLSFQACHTHCRSLLRMGSCGRSSIVARKSRLLSYIALVLSVGSAILRTQCMAALAIVTTAGNPGMDGFLRKQFRKEKTSHSHR